MVRRLSLIVVLVVVAIVLTTPAWAQSHLNGDWVGLFHEDEPERAPGPDPGDYTGLPVNAAGRLYADSWDASRLTLPEHQCRAHVSPYILRGPIRVRITEEREPDVQDVVAIKQFMSTWAQERTIWLDGRPHPSGEGAAHLDGVLDGRVAGPDAESRDHAHQAGLAPAQRRADERQDDDDGVLLPPRRRPDAGQHHRGSGVPVRAAREDHRICASTWTRGRPTISAGCSARRTRRSRA